jgi:pimeloyl-ACP methyl ester carboxylesterase
VTGPALRAIGSRQVNVQVVGDAADPAVLMLHGNPVDHRILRAPMERLFAGRPGWRRVYVDLPGFGASPASEDVRGSDDALAVVLDLLADVAGDGPALLVGQSWGGYLAHAAAAARPDAVAGLAMLCPMTVPDRALRDVPVHPAVDLAEGVGDGADEDDLREFREIAVVQDAHHWSFFVESVLPGLQAADPDAVSRIDERYALTPSVAPPFAGPTLIVTGRQDSVVGFRDAERFSERLPRATFVVLDGAGHHAHIERETVVAALLGDWLDRVAASL